MARPQRNNVDYFPFFCKEGNTTKYIDNTYGNDGFATWVKILRALATTDFHYLDLSNRKVFLTMISTCKISEEVLTNILNDLAEFDEIDKELWNQKIVWSDRFINSIQDAYTKRSNSIINKDELHKIREGILHRKPHSNVVNSPVKPQTKLNKTKLNKTKLNKTIKKVEDFPEKIIDPFPFQIEFLNLWEKWKKYRRDEFKKKWASIDTEQTAYNHLVEISEKNENVAQKIINESISQHWQGLFPLKNQNTNGKTHQRIDQPTNGARKSDFGGKL